MNKVVANSGLNLRAKPTTQSQKVGHVPYGETVEILHREHYGLDTLQQIDTEKNSYKVIGYWLKVSYKGISGYVNNAYLNTSKDWDFQKDNHLYNNDFVLLYPGITCVSNYVKLSQYYWYGYYSNASDCTLKPIKVEMNRNVIEMNDVQTIVKEDTDLLFIVGSRKPMQTGPINEVVKDFQINGYEYRREESNYLAFSEPYFESYGDYSDRSYDFTLKIKHKHEYQYIMESRNRGDLHTIKWMGDLDQDGRMDYIIDFGEKSYHSILYLSSQRIKGSLLKAVARFKSAYCC